MSRRDSIVAIAMTLLHALLAAVLLSERPERRGSVRRPAGKPRRRRSGPAAA